MPTTKGGVGDYVFELGINPGVKNPQTHKQQVVCSCTETAVSHADIAQGTPDSLLFEGCC